MPHTSCSLARRECHWTTAASSGRVLRGPALTTVCVKPYVLVYADGNGAPGDRLNVYARRSFDDGTTWDGPTLLSKDASGNATGGQTINVLGQDYLVENDKASIFAPSSYSGSNPRNILVSWTSSYCPDLTSGNYPNGLQKVATALTPPRPYKCLWTARSTDPVQTGSPSSLRQITGRRTMSWPARR
jgi:hypothetical protein